jgi:hypothetical protein
MLFYCVCLLTLITTSIVNGEYIVFQNYLSKNLSNNKPINIYYSCIGNNQPSSITLLLQGGPGGQNDLEYAIENLYNLNTNGLYCITDYRGVGYSSQLSCSNQTQIGCDVTPNCQEELALEYNLTDFYTTEAAKDVIDIINILKSTFQPTYINLYGVSYGTFWLQRIMQINNTIADKWIFDSVVLPPWFEGGGWFEYNNSYPQMDVILKYINLCTLHKVCGKYLNSDQLNEFLAIVKNSPDPYKQIISSNLEDYFINPYNYPNNIVDIINYIISVINKSNLVSKRNNICPMNDIIYYQVKANELYTPISFDILNEYPIDTISVDYYNTLPWMNEYVHYIEPIITNGKVLVLAGEFDIQTTMNASYILHNYFINNNVSSVFKVGLNWGHGILYYNSSVNELCGFNIINNFLIGSEIDVENCLENSAYKNFNTAAYNNLFILNKQSKRDSLVRILNILLIITLLLSSGLIICLFISLIFVCLITYNKRCSTIYYNYVHIDPPNYYRDQVKLESI